MLNMDFSKLVSIDTLAMNWLQSPAQGVWRKPLARQEIESGHATSIVKYDPGSHFSQHNHPLGEEIFVLEGTFSDHSGDYSSGSYLRNPKGYIHAPYSKNGCLILVKLHQFQPSDHASVKHNNKLNWEENQLGVQTLPLHKHNAEEVKLLYWPANEPYAWSENVGGEEIYVIKGSLECQFPDRLKHYSEGSWLRVPKGMQFVPSTVFDTLLWVKTGHLTL